MYLSVLEEYLSCWEHSVVINLLSIYLFVDCFGCNSGRGVGNSAKSLLRPLYSTERNHYTKHYSKLHWARYDNVFVHLIKYEMLFFSLNKAKLHEVMFSRILKKAISRRGKCLIARDVFFTNIYFTVNNIVTFQCGFVVFKNYWARRAHFRAFKRTE